MTPSTPGSGLRRQQQEQRFRASLVASGSIHAVLLLTAILWPTLWQSRSLSPSVVQVQVIPAPLSPPPRSPETSTPEPEQPEPIPAVTSEPEPVPHSLEQLRRAHDKERKRQQELQERKRQQELQERRRRQEEERKRREEEARRRPQRAARRGATSARTQQARRQEIAFTGTESGQQHFTVEEFPFTYYVLRIRDMVGSEWRPPARGAWARERRVEVFFRIGHDGRLAVPPRVENTSGDVLFDQAALRAVASAAPFPPLPHEYQGQSLGVRFAFVQE